MQFINYTMIIQKYGIKYAVGSNMLQFYTIFYTFMTLCKIQIKWKIQIPTFPHVSKRNTTIDKLASPSHKAKVLLNHNFSHLTRETAQILCTNFIMFITISVLVSSELKWCSRKYTSLHVLKEHAQIPRTAYQVVTDVQNPIMWTL